MHVELHPLFAGTAEGQIARDLTSACVHCGFCLETCPTYLDSRDERDGEGVARSRPRRTSANTTEQDQ